MRLLRDINISYCINSSEHNLSEDFFMPCLKHSILYDRGVGFFSSGWLRINAQGMKAFVENGGKARWITSPVLSKSDWEALKTGDQASKDSFLRALLSKNIDHLEAELEQDTLNTLSWLIADGVLGFRLAVPRNNLDGEFHDKFGIFADIENNRLSFIGSVNESIQGTRNYESLSIFRSWEVGQKDYLENAASRFEKLWNNQDLNLRTYPIDEANYLKIIKLRSGERPYQFEEGLSNYNKRPKRKRQPHLPDKIKLRDYQQQAIDEWFKNHCQGIFKMATGTGKTITALAAILRLFEEEKRLLVIISCPFIHLAQQWVEEASTFEFAPILIGESKKKWEDEASHQVQLFNRHKKDIVFFITTNTSFSSDTFQKIISGALLNTVIIFDEAHYAGARNMRTHLPKVSPYQLGLSATPERYRDEVGTQAIFDYFGKVVFELPIEEAIGVHLTKYLYYPIPVELTLEEFKEYSELSNKIKKLYISQNEDLIETAEKLAIKRARLLNNAVNKLEWLKDNLDDKSLDFSLFYAGERIFDEVKLILSAQYKLRLHEFTARQSLKERKRLLQDFARGDIQTLVAMKCLDEGVDIPPTRTAYFLASSSNPREFVQRRGRILRKYKGKDKAFIYDLISIPPMEYIEQGKKGGNYAAAKSAITRELKRVKEFANMAMNKHSALNELIDILNKLELLDKIN